MLGLIYFAEKTIQGRPTEKRETLILTTWKKRKKKRKKKKKKMSHASTQPTEDWGDRLFMELSGKKPNQTKQ